MKRRLIEWHERHGKRLGDRFDKWLLGEVMWYMSDEISYWMWKFVKVVFKRLGW